MARDDIIHKRYVRVVVTVIAFLCFLGLFSSIVLAIHTFDRVHEEENISYLSEVTEDILSSETVKLTKGEVAVIGAIMVTVFLVLLLFAIITFITSKNRKQLLDAKEVVLTSLSHEIGTAINAVMGSSEILLGEELTLRQSEEVLRIANSGDGLLTFVNDVLDGTNIEAIKLADVEEYKESESLRNLVKEETITVVHPKELNEDIPAWLEEYHSEEINITEGIRHCGSLKTYVRILQTYLDTSGEKLAALYEWIDEDIERFIMEIHTMKGANSAVGAYELAEKAQRLEELGKMGKLERVKEELLPYLSGIEYLMAEIQFLLNWLNVQVPDLIFARQNKKHIVVVDDNEANLKLAEEVLRESYCLTKLGSGSQLLQFLKIEKPDLILLDIQMPHMNGYETLEAIQSNAAWKDIPVLFLTDEIDGCSEREGFLLGVKDFITKPFDNVVMLSRIRSQIELYQYRTDLEEVISDKTQKIEDLQHMITVSWAEAIESRDGTTGSHVRNTTRYFEAMFDILSEIPQYQDVFDKEVKDDMLRASSLHDIGKIGISDLVLKKPGPLTREEFEQMKEHTKIGADMIQKIIDNSRSDSFLQYAREMAYCHHERWDGTGYPMGLKEDEIPVFIQVLSIADVFDALTAVRPYKSAFTMDEALGIMQGDRSKFFSPELLDIFIENQDIIRQLLDRKTS